MSATCVQSGSSLNRIKLESVQRVWPIGLIRLNLSGPLATDFDWVDKVMMLRTDGYFSWPDQKEVVFFQEYGMLDRGLIELRQGDLEVRLYYETKGKWAYIFDGESSWPSSRRAGSGDFRL